MVVYSIGLTEFRESELALELQHQRYRSFAYMAMDWFWELDSELRYEYHSGHQPSLTGVEHSKLVGQHRIESVKLNAIENDGLQQHNKSLLEHKPFDNTVSWRDNKGSIRQVNVIGKPEFNKKGTFTGYLGCGREVTQEIALQS